MNKRKSIILLIDVIFLAILIFLDQNTKYFAIVYLKGQESLKVVDGVFEFNYLENRGAAFGMFKDQRWIFMLTSTVMILGLSLYLYLGFAENKLYEVSMAMIISGGIGNMIDRLALGYVIDFIDFRLINFAVFNGADSFVCIGAGILILALVKDIIAESKKKKNGDSNAK